MRTTGLATIVDTVGVMELARRACPTASSKCDQRRRHSQREQFISATASDSHGLPLNPSQPQCTWPVAPISIRRRRRVWRDQHSAPSASGSHTPLTKGYRFFHVGCGALRCVAVSHVDTQRPTQQPRGDVRSRTSTCADRI